MTSLLLVLGLLGALASGQAEEDACSVLHLATPDKLTDRIVVVVKDSADESVSRVHDGNTVYVTVTIPPSYNGSSVDCLLGLGLGRKWRRMMAASCQTAQVMEGGATCVFTVANVNASRDLEQERLEVRVGVKHTTGYLRATYDGNPFSYIPEQRDDRPLVPDSTPTPSPVVIVEQVKLEDPHNSKMEAYLAAKWAEQRQHMADDEDKNSEGTWQKLKEDEKRQHEAEIQQELQEYEVRKAEEDQRHKAMIRREMMDLEENEAREEEEETKTKLPPTLQPGLWVDRVQQEEVEVEVDPSNSIGSDSTAAHNTGFYAVLLLALSTILAAILL